MHICMYTCIHIYIYIHSFTIIGHGMWEKDGMGSRSKGHGIVIGAIGGLFLRAIFFRFGHCFWISVSLLLCFSAFLLLSFLLSLLLCFYSSLLLRFSASPLCCLSASPFFCFSLLFCLSSFSANFFSLLLLLTCFSAPLKPSLNK